MLRTCCRGAQPSSPSGPSLSATRWRDLVLPENWVSRKPLQNGPRPSTCLDKHQAELEVDGFFASGRLNAPSLCVDSPPMPPATTTTSPKQTAAPERSLVQRMDALQRANEIRTKRAQLKRDLKAGRHSIHQLLLKPPDYVETAKVVDMLLAVPKYGRVKVDKILRQCKISPSKTVGGLSERQRNELVGLLRR